MGCWLCLLMIPTVRMLLLLIVAFLYSAFVLFPVSDAILVQCRECNNNTHMTCRLLLASSSDGLRNKDCWTTSTTAPSSAFLMLKQTTTTMLAIHREIHRAVHVPPNQRQGLPTLTMTCACFMNGKVGPALGVEVRLAFTNSFAKPPFTTSGTDMCQRITSHLCAKSHIQPTLW